MVLQEVVEVKHWDGTTTMSEPEGHNLELVSKKSTVESPLRTYSRKVLVRKRAGEAIRNMSERKRVAKLQEVKEVPALVLQEVVELMRDKTLSIPTTSSRYNPNRINTSEDTFKDLRYNESNQKFGNNDFVPRIIHKTHRNRNAQILKGKKLIKERLKNTQKRNVDYPGITGSPQTVLRLTGVYEEKKLPVVFRPPGGQEKRSSLERNGHQILSNFLL